MFALWITARAEGVDRKRANLRRKLNNADVCSSRNSVPAFLATHWCGVEREDRAGLRILKQILKVSALTFIDTLQPAKFAPRNFPRSEIALERIENTGQCDERILLLISQPAIVVKTEDRHRDRVVPTSSIPPGELVMDFAQSRRAISVLVEHKE